jgi:farnesyl diphosphate synthase
LLRHRFIVLYKTAFYSFYLPVACAMLMSRIPETYIIPPSTTVQPYAIASSILLPLGEYFQIQDDYLDYSGTPEQIGKVGTDIVDNKCSWVINTALSLATPAQRAILDENYGRKDAQKEKKVKAVFAEVGVGKVYEEYEERVVRELKQKIGEIVEVEGGLKREVFESFLGKIYKRSK